jgi:putative oxidoreductase
MNPYLEIDMQGKHFIPALGRTLIGVPFLMSGLSKLGAYAGTVGYIASAGLPTATLAYYRARLVALVLALFSLATAVFFHNDFGDQNQMIHFLKNVMLAGGLLQITYFGAGAFSMDARRQDAPVAKTADNRFA